MSLHRDVLIDEVPNLRSVAIVYIHNTVPHQDLADVYKTYFTYESIAWSMVNRTH